MAKYTMTIHGRRLYVHPDRDKVGELWDGIANVAFQDDTENNNDTDLTFYSDGERFTCVSAYDEDESIESNQKDDAIAGTRTNGTTFTRDAGTWVVDAKINWSGFFYTDGAEDDGSWLKISDNDTTTLTVVGTLPTGCDRVKLAARHKLRHNISVLPPEGFYGSFFQYKFEKKVPSDGNVKWSGLRLRTLPRPYDPEFLASTGSISNAW